MLMIFAIIAALFAPPPETCDAIHALVGGELVEWVGYPQGWNLPDDLKRIGRIDFADGGIWNDYSRNERARYVWVFLDYTVDGEPRGAHNFCGPYRISDD